MRREAELTSLRSVLSSGGKGHFETHQGHRNDMAVLIRHLLPFRPFRAVRVTDGAPLFFKARQPLFLKPIVVHGPTDQAHLTHPPVAFSRATRFVNLVFRDPEFQELAPSRARSSPLLPVVKPHASTHPLITGANLAKRINNLPGTKFSKFSLMPRILAGKKIREGSLL